MVFCTVVLLNLIAKNFVNMHTDYRTQIFLIGTLITGVLFMGGCSLISGQESAPEPPTPPAAEETAPKLPTPPADEESAPEPPTPPVAEETAPKLPTPPAEEPAPEKTIAQLIVGKWEMAPNGRASSGDITFNSNSHYEMNERLQDGTGVGTKGEYKLNSNADPVRIDLCLDQCGQPGSEWTTRFGIMRFLSDGKLEIYTSPDGQYPSVFPADSSGDYDMILTRM